MNAIEFYSGIGGFSQAANRCAIKTLAAFDQDQVANQVFEINYGLKPISRNLDTVRPEEIPEADLWWMSPPCTPYTVRGLKRDDKDRRAVSMLNLIRIICKRKPQIVLLENVVGFETSRVNKILKDRLSREGYQCSQIVLCPTQFGIPMRRPRIFLCASRGKTCDLQQAASLAIDQTVSRKPLSDFLTNESVAKLQIDEGTLERYAAVINVIDPTVAGQQTICFTSGYGKFWKASGSLLRMEDGSVRKFAPCEILKLMGFADHFQMPMSISLAKQWKLIGNSLEVRSVLHVLRAIQNNLI